jgi:hypothetical protein
MGICGSSGVTKRQCTGISFIKPMSRLAALARIPTSERFFNAPLLAYQSTKPCCALIGTLVDQRA